MVICRGENLIKKFYILETFEMFGSGTENNRRNNLTPLSRPEAKREQKAHRLFSPTFTVSLFITATRTFLFPLHPPVPAPSDLLLENPAHRHIMAPFALPHGPFSPPPHPYHPRYPSALSPPPPPPCRPPLPHLGFRRHWQLNLTWMHIVFNSARLYIY